MKKMYRTLSLLVTIILLSNTFSIQAQELSRRASFEAGLSSPSQGVPGVLIRSLDENSPMAKAGLSEGDVILRVNDRLIKDGEDYGSAISALRGEVKTIVEVKRGHELLTKEVVFNPSPTEQNESVETIYGSILSDFGIRQRTIITKPESGGKHPAIFLVQGLSCSSIEHIPGRTNNWMRLITDIVEKSNMVVMRVEKPGVGDSEGDCGQTDFMTELNGYETAIKELKQKAYVDTANIIVYGNSMGSMLAPYLATKHDLAGVISDGTFFKSWYEHMLEIERRILEIEGKSQAEIYTLMNEVYIPLYYEMHIKKRSFEDILTDNPTFKQYHRQGLNHMYGRPMEYYHQLQDFNVGNAWENVTVPVRVRWGTNDWIMSEFDNDMIEDVLESTGHEDYEVYKYPGMDHWATIHPDYASSFYFEPGEWEDEISQQIVDWAREIASGNQ